MLMNKSLSCWVFLIAFYGKFVNPTELKLGFVYDPSGPFANAFLGYKFYANKINSMGGLVVGQPNSSTTYQIKIVEHSNSDITDPFWQTSGSHIMWDNNLKMWVYDDSRARFPQEQDRHYIQQQRLWKYDNVDFELGGTTDVAANETMTSARRNLINMVCCVGPDNVFEQAFPTETVFGMQCTNEKYTQETILTLALKGARTIAITYSNSLFTKSTCTAAKIYALQQASTPYKLVYEYTYAQSWETTTDFTANPVHDVATNTSYDLKKAFTTMASLRPDVWIHCGNMKSGVFGLKLLNSIGFRPKATLQTVAPNSIATFMGHLGPLGNYVLGVGQWHPAMTYRDGMFGSASQYSADFKAFSGADAEYVGAGAAATAYVLGMAIQQHYATHTHHPGVFDTAMIVSKLKKMRLQTFFGDLEFNAFRRNVAKVPATLQNLPDSTQSYGINQACVLPVAFGNAEIVYPDPLSIAVATTSDSLSAYVIIAIAVCTVFLLLLAVTIYLVHGHYNVDQRAIRIKRSKNLPVHLSILKQACSPDLLRIIDENKDRINLQQDLDGKTALDLTLEEEIFSGNNITKDVVFRLFVDVFEEIYGQYNDDTELSLDLLINPRIFCWARLAQLSSDKALEIVEAILDHFPQKCKIFSKLLDEHGRRVVDIASPKCQLAIQRRSWLHRRYEIREGRPEHVSATAVVVIATDHQMDGVSISCDMGISTSGSDRTRQLNGSKKVNMVALKFMRSFEQFSCEIRCRSSLLIQRDHVVGIITHYGSGDKEKLGVENETPHNEYAFRQDAITKGFQSYPFCLVMEAGDDTLRRIIDDQHIAGTDWDEIKSITKQVTLALKHLHEYGFIHGDIKPSNIIAVGQKIKLIDLDASASFDRGESAGAKFSSGYIPPELLYLDQDGHPKVRSYSVLPFTSEKIQGDYDLAPATPAIDMWALGVLLFLMCTGSSLFQCAVDDNIFKREDLIALYNWSSTDSNTRLEKVSNRYARNLLSMLLNKDPLRRPSPSRVMDHPFLTNQKSVRFPGEEAIYDVFLSYRVASDQKIAQLIYSKLTKRGIKVWFDKTNILPGRDWEQEFADGLLMSSCFVCLLSRNAINHPTKSMQNFNALTERSRADNVLVEWTLALEFAERGLLTKIYPIMIGDKVTKVSDAGDPTVTYTNYFSSGCHPSSCPNVIVEAVEQKAKVHLERQGLGHPYRDSSSVHKNVSDIISRQGSFIEGDLTMSVKKLVSEVCVMILQTSADNCDTSANVQMRKKLIPSVVPPLVDVDYIPRKNNCRRPLSFASSFSSHSSFMSADEGPKVGEREDADTDTDKEGSGCSPHDPLHQACLSESGSECDEHVNVPLTVLL